MRAKSPISIANTQWDIKISSKEKPTDSNSEEHQKEKPTSLLSFQNTMINGMRKNEMNIVSTASMDLDSQIIKDRLLQVTHTSMGFAASPGPPTMRMS